MPGIFSTTGSSSSSSPSSDEGGPTPKDVGPNQHLREDYPAASLPGYEEKPLDEQLEPIAVVGMGCRLPGDVSSASEFWDMMMNKRSGQNPKVPSNRFNIDAHYHKNRDRPGSFPVMGGYFINEDLENFDPGPFNISPVEAMWMDPQQRKLLEVVYEALESGGITLEAIAGTRTGVFAASFTSDWQQMAFKEPSFRHTMAATGVDPGILSDRISYVFNLNGPSVLCNTACSSSIYALHNACIALRNKECEGAIVGGTNLVFTVDQQMNTAKIGVLSPRGTCFTFDESADGYGRAEGVGAVYLKRLSDAVRDGDPIRGVIRSSAVNHNGKASSASISFPGKDGQAYVIDEAYSRGGNLDPLLTGYFETHGTGTAVGDPIEAEAISISINRTRKPGIDDKLMIGAVKTNIGHGEAASGLSALIKAILIVERGVIPPTIGISKLSSKIKWDDWQIQVPVEPTPFPRHLPVRRVSVNTCGYGGTNAHVIVEEAASMLRRPQTYKYIDNTHTPGNKLITPRRTSHRKRPFLLPFSAHDKHALLRNIEAHARVADKYNLLDLSYTLATRRTNFASKGFAISSHKILKDVFSDIKSSFVFSEKKAAPPTVGFVFTGQGSQWPRMGAEIMQYNQRFLSTIRNLDMDLDELRDGPEWSIEDTLLEYESSSAVHEAEFSQPLCTAIQIAMVDLLGDWGIRPVVTVGHSSGEIAAAYAAGLISAKMAITAAYYRGQVTKDVKTGGSMMAVGLGAEAAEKYLSDYRGKVVVACHNSPAGVTLSGDSDVLEELKVRLDEEKIFARNVKTDGKAYHSHYMAPVAEKYESLFRAAKESTSFYLPEERPLGVKMVSSLTNAVVSDTAVLDEAYWSANLRSPVLFNQAIQTLLKDKEFEDVNLLIEIGPHSSMSGPIRQIKAEVKAEKLEYLSTLSRGKDSSIELLKLAGELFLRSYPLNMERVTKAYLPQTKKSATASVIVDLPRYQWNYTRQFWPENRASREHRHATHMRHDVLGQQVIGASISEPTWRNVLRMRDLPWLKDHSLGGEAVFPAAAYFSMAVEAVTQINEKSEKPEAIESYVLRDVSIKKALVTPDNDDGIEVLTSLRPSLFGANWWDFSVSSIDAENSKKEHMAGSININAAPSGGRKPRKIPQFPQRASSRALNDALRDVGFDYGPTFQDMDDIRFDGKRYEASCITKIKQHVDESLGESRYVLHPASVDSVLQLSIAAIYAGRTAAMDCGVVPIQVDEVTFWPPTEEQLAVGTASGYAWVPRRGIRSFEGSAQMTAHNGEMVLDIVNVRTTSYEAAVPQKDDSALQPAPYGEMKWEVDIDSLGSPAKISGLTALDLTNLALFKSLNLKVFETGTKHAVSIFEKNPRCHYTSGVFPDDGELAKAKKLVEGYSTAKVTPLNPLEDLESQSFTPASYDVLLTTTELAPKLRGMVKAGGFIITTDITTLERVPSGHEQEKTATSGAHKVQLVYRKSQAPILPHVKAALETIGWHVQVADLQTEGEPGLPTGHVVMLADFEGPLLLDVTEREFTAIQKIITSSSSLLWVTNGAILDGKRPEYALVSGLARAVRSEQASLDFRTLDLDTDNLDSTQIVDSIVRIAQLQFAQSEEVPEREYCMSNGKTYISRLVRNTALNELLTPSKQLERLSFTPGSRISGKIQNGKVVFGQHGATAAPKVEAGHVEVQVQCSGLTHEGVLVITGSDYPTTFSHEIGGIVTEVGSGVTTLKRGDRVVGFNVDRFSSQQQVPTTMLHKLTPKEDMSTAVSLLMSYAGALYGLDSLAKVQPDETVLVLHNTGASGVAAVKVAQARGAIAYVEAKTIEEFDFLHNTLGLPAENIIQPTDGSVSVRMHELTNGQGVDVVFSSGGTVDANAAREAWRSIASFGRFVDGGRKDVLNRKALDAVPVTRNALYMPFDLIYILDSRPQLVSNLLPTIMDMFSKGSIAAPGPVKRLHLSALDSAVSTFSNDFGAAKSIIEYVESDEQIPVIPLPKSAKPAFRPDATYLLVGCLGGLGRSLTTWMMECGARRFAFLARSGKDSKAAATLVQDIEARGANVLVIRGDATIRADVVRAVSQVPSEFPIRGVVHAAMVLRDGLFHSMSFNNWKTAVAPKVDGAMNLHSVLASTPLDFFLMTSSVSGIMGTPGQSNYAAANSYLDALARHRVKANKTATACVIPMVLGVGVVAENDELEESLRRKGMYGIDEECLLESFEAAIATTSMPDVPTVDHVVIGLDPALLQKAVVDEDTATGSFWLEDARFSHVVHAMNSSKDSAGGAGAAKSVLAAIKGAATPAEAAALAATHFVAKLARLLMLAEDDVDPASGSIASYGIDSMIGVDLRNWIFKEFRMDIPFQQLLAPALTIDKLSVRLCAYNGITAE